MAKIIVYNNDTDRMEIYYRGLSESMPYNTNRTLTVKEFRGASSSNTLCIINTKCYQCHKSIRYPPYTKGINRTI